MRGFSGIVTSKFTICFYKNRFVVCFSYYWALGLSMGLVQCAIRQIITQKARMWLSTIPRLARRLAPRRNIEKSLARSAADARALGAFISTNSDGLVSYIYTDDQIFRPYLKLTLRIDHTALHWNCVSHKSGVFDQFQRACNKFYFRWISRCHSRLSSIDFSMIPAVNKFF